MGTSNAGYWSARVKQAGLAAVGGGLFWGLALVNAALAAIGLLGRRDA